LLAWGAGIPERIGFSASAGALLLTRRVPFTWTLHDLERNLTLLMALRPEYRPAAILPAAGARGAERLVGVHPGSAWPTKRWLAERYEELCRRLAGEGFKVVLIGGPDDRGLCADLASRCGAVDFSGRTLTDLRGLMARLSLFVTNDSGPMHVATAAGVPTLAIFGPTTRELGFFPYGPGHRVLEHSLACRPCSLHGGRSCPQGHFLCMRLTTVQEVFDAAREMLGAGVLR
jgi:heptosyltransferase-2